MRRSGLTLPVLLAVACADGPTAPDVARAPPHIGLTEEVVAALHALVTDPFVHDLIAQADQTAQHTMRDVLGRIAAGEPHAIRRALSEAHVALQQADDDEAVVPRAALGHTVDAVQTVLDSAVRQDVGAGDATSIDRRGSHDE